MSYDQSQLVKAYLRAYELTKDEVYSEVCARACFCVQCPFS